MSEQLARSAGYLFEQGKSAYFRVLMHLNGKYTLKLLSSSDPHPPHVKDPRSLTMEVVANITKLQFIAQLCSGPSKDPHIARPLVFVSPSFPHAIST